jgi:phage-related protein
MNEELKIIITAATEGAKKGIQDVKKELGGVTGSAQGASKGFGSAMKGVAVAAAAAVGAIIAIGAALIKLGKASLDYQRAQAKLNTAFLSVGSTAQQAAEAYNGLYRFLGDIDTSAEAAAHLAKLTTNQQELAEWTRICQGIYATFGDSLKIESLTEAANETARVGKVTGTFADALTWAGQSEDEFNAKLATTTSYAEREALIRSTLNGLYGEAADIYERNNKALLEYNESQAKLDSSMAAAGAAVTPLLTALNNLGAALFNALQPALSAIIPAIATFVNWVAQGVQAVLSLFSAITGASLSVKAFASVSTGVSNAAGGAGQLASNLDKAAGAAEKVKRATMGFDELNVVPSNKAGGGGGGGGAGAGGYMSPDSAQNFASEVEETEEKSNSLLAAMKRIGTELKNVFAPAIGAWKDAFASVGEAWEEAKPDFASGAESLLSGFTKIGIYLKDEYIPDLVNSFSVNFAPMFADLFGFMLTEAGETFKTLGKIIEDASSDVIIPALDGIKTAAEDTFEIMGNTWAEKGKEILKNAGDTMDGLRAFIDGLYYDLLLPIWNKIKAKAEELWNNDLKPLVDTIVNSLAEIGNNILILYNQYMLPVIQWFQNEIYPIIVRVVSGIVDTVGDVISAVAQVVRGVMTTINGLVNFITGVFTGDWEKAWNGVKEIFRGIWMQLSGIAKLPLNTLIGTINNFLSAIGSGLNSVINAINGISITIPSWVPKYGGKSFGANLDTVNIPQIPKLAEGGIVDRATLAMIGERGREAVVPLENNTAWMDKLVDKFLSRSNGPSKIVLMLDGKELGWANINSINNITRQTGALQLVLS